MEHSPSHYLFLLKVSTISVSGIVIIKPSDCELLQLSVTSATGRHISLIALKRIFGFEKSLFSPSLFTLNLLANYCDFSSWDAYCEQQDEDENLTHKNPLL